jgi:hypothetical protein
MTRLTSNIAGRFEEFGYSEILKEQRSSADKVKNHFIFGKFKLKSYIFIIKQLLLKASRDCCLAV